jgi:hypothetical protein
VFLDNLESESCAGLPYYQDRLEQVYHRYFRSLVTALLCLVVCGVGWWLFGPSTPTPLVLNTSLRFTPEELEMYATAQCIPLEQTELDSGVLNTGHTLADIHDTMLAVLKKIHAQGKRNHSLGHNLQILTARVVICRNCSGSSSSQSVHRGHLQYDHQEHGIVG